MPGIYQLVLFLAATHTTIRWNYIIDNNEFNRRGCSFFERKYYITDISAEYQVISHALAWLIDLPLKDFLFICIDLQISNYQWNLYIWSHSFKYLLGGVYLRNEKDDINRMILENIVNIFAILFKRSNEDRG